MFFIISTVLLFTACLKYGDETIVLEGKAIKTDTVDINDPNSVQNSLVFTNETFNRGSFPNSTSGNNSLSNSQSSIAVNNGNTLTLPIIYNSSSEPQIIHLQVVGATNGYYSVTPTVVQNANGYCYIEFDIPDYIENGYFEIIISVEYADGTISNQIQTTINITDVVINCENAYVSGSSGLTFTNLQLGTTSGNVSIVYDTYSAPDRIDIYQQGTWLTGTGENPNSPIPPMCDCDSPLPGFVGENSTLNFNYNPVNGRTIIVVVSGCLPDGTAWEWQLITSPECQ